ncbi:MAG: hypothetical protein FJ086_00180 [Deltaproteobacteria bacterium]|nr:hypothetical protein [Deltaproteobacteria bacterium]
MLRTFSTWHLGLLLAAAVTGCQCTPRLAPDAGAPAPAVDAGVLPPEDYVIVDGGGPTPPPFRDAGTPPERVDGGHVPRLDGGEVSWDAGLPADAGLSIHIPSAPFPADGAFEDCNGALLADALDAGAASGDVYFPVCVALRQVSGTAALSGAPVGQTVSWTLKTSDYSSQYVDSPQDGGWSFRALRSPYDDFTWHPVEIFPTHDGPLSTGPMPLLTDQSRDLATAAWEVSGTTRFGGAPWLPSTNPRDFTLGAASPAYSQSASATTADGGYAVRLVEGTYGLAVSMPKEALGTTAINGYPLPLPLQLDQPATVDVDLPASLLEGTLTVDNQQLPDRIPGGPDFTLEYERTGQPVALSAHEATAGNLRAVLPQDTYAVNLLLPDAVDRHLPSYLEHFRLTPSLSLAQDQYVQFPLSTFRWEGAILLDGQPVPALPGTLWTMYAYGYWSNARPWFVSYYTVPADVPSFLLRLFPSTYYLLLWLDEGFHPDLAAGWFLVDAYKQVTQDFSQVVDVETREFTGTLTIDGQPATSPLTVGTLTFQNSEDSYRKRIETRDGTFRVRVPKGTYDVFFTIDADAYPGYAVGRTLVASSVDLAADATRALAYDTVRISGPVQLSGAVVPNALPAGAELTLKLYPLSYPFSFTATLEGGTGAYAFRIPPGVYDVDVVLAEGVLPKTAWGRAPYAVAWPLQRP